MLTAELTEVRANAGRWRRACWAASSSRCEGHGQVRPCADTELSSLGPMLTCRRKGVRLAIPVLRLEVVWERCPQIAEKDRRPALEMDDAEVAEIGYCREGWKHEPLP